MKGCLSTADIEVELELTIWESSSQVLHTEAHLRKPSREVEESQNLMRWAEKVMLTSETRNCQECSP